MDNLLLQLDIKLPWRNLVFNKSLDCTGKKVNTFGNLVIKRVHINKENR